MLRVLTDHPHYPATVNHLALVTNLLNRCTNLHKFSSVTGQRRQTEPQATNPGKTTGLFRSCLLACHLPCSFTCLLLVPIDDPARVRSYGLSSTATRSPGRIRMKFFRIRPETCASTWCLFSSSTLNIAFGNVSTTVAITSIASSFDKPYPALHPGSLAPHTRDPLSPRYQLLRVCASC